MLCQRLVTQQGSQGRVEHVSLVVETEVEILDKQENERQIPEEAEFFLASYSRHR